MMIVEARPLVDVTREAIRVLFQKLGAVNTVRFLNQFTIGYGNYLDEREELFGYLTLEELINEVRRHQRAGENI